MKYNSAASEANQTVRKTTLLNRLIIINIKPFRNNKII